MNLGLCHLPTEIEIALGAAENAIEFKGQKFVPDHTKGYFQFAMSHAFPVATVYGQGATANVIAKSHASLLHQNLNREHQIKSYHAARGKDNYVEDQVIGSIVAVDFPHTPAAGWKLTSADKSPGISGVAVFYKQMTAMSKIIGDHQTGRHNYTVSMEVMYPYEEAGFAVAGGGKFFPDTTPRDFADAGYDYVGWKDAPDQLRETFSVDRNRIVSKYRGKPVTILMGGLDNQVHYSGLGMVKYGAEGPAEILRLAASAGDALVDPFAELAQCLSEATAALYKKG